MVKCIFSYTYASKTQEFNFKIKVVPVNLKTNMRMNVIICLTLWMNEFFIHLIYGWKKLISFSTCF
jgi:hypothetical protein